MTEYLHTEDCPFCEEADVTANETTDVFECPNCGETWRDVECRACGECGMAGNRDLDLCESCAGKLDRLEDRD